MTESIAQSAALFFLLCARMAPLAWLVPWLCVPSAPPLLPVAITAVLGVLLWPIATAAAPVLPLSLVTLAAFALREALIGFVYAFALALPIYAVQWSGALAGRGVAQEASYATLQRMLAVCGVFALGGHRVALSMLGDSLLQRPIGALSPLRDPTAVALGSAHLFGDAFALAVLLSLPVIAALALAELGVALAARGSSASAFAVALLPLRGGLVLWVSAMVALLWLGSASDMLRTWFVTSSRLWNAL